MAAVFTVENEIKLALQHAYAALENEKYRAIREAREAEKNYDYELRDMREKWLADLELAIAVFEDEGLYVPPPGFERCQKI